MPFKKIEKAEELVPLRLSWPKLDSPRLRIFRRAPGLMAGLFHLLCIVAGSVAAPQSAGILLIGDSNTERRMITNALGHILDSLYGHFGARYASGGGDLADSTHTMLLSIISGKVILQGVDAKLVARALCVRSLNRAHEGFTGQGWGKKR